MRKAAIRDGDSTTTGGRVFAFGASINDKGRKVALDGNEATCGKCDGVFKILGTGRNILNGARNVVVDDDRVLCPCGKNRVIVGSNPGIWLNTAKGRKPTNTTSLVEEGNKPNSGKNRRWILVQNELGKPLANRSYIARVAGDQQFGTTDARGYALVETDREQAVAIHVLFSSPRRELSPVQGS